MNIMERIRVYHAILASSSILAYVTGEFGIVHAWLGYGVAAVIMFRLLWALGSERQVGLARFYPSFEGLSFHNAFTHPAISKGLMLGIAISVIAVTATGIAMDKGKAIGLANAELFATAYADDDEHSDGKEDGGFLDEALEETHEFFANLMLLFVGVHVSYIVLFKRPLARFMLFIPKRTGHNK